MNITEILKKGGLVLIACISSAFVASLAVAFLIGVGGNIEVVGFTSLAFDPQITIAYMILHYFLSEYFYVERRLPLFLFALLLSFTTNFIQGSIFLVLFYALLRAFKLIGVEQDG
jgi:hypothetical protein